MAQFQQSVLQTEFGLSSEAAQLFALSEQKRDLGYFLVESAPFEASIHISSEDILAYYSDNKDSFQSKPEVKLAYVTLSLKDMLQTVSGQNAEEKHETAMAQLLEQAEQMAALAFENPQSLEPIRDQLHLTIQESDWLTKDNTIEGVLAEPIILKEAFSDELIAQRHNSELLDIEGEQFVVLRVLDYKPADVMPLAQVSDEIKQLLKMQHAKKQAKQKADLILEHMKTNKISDIARAQSMRWHELKQVQRSHQETDLSHIIQYAFSLPRPQADKPSIGLVALNSGDFAVVQILSVRNADINDSNFTEKKQVFEQGIAQSFGELELNLYAAHLFERAKIKR